MPETGALKDPWQVF